MVPSEWGGRAGSTIGTSPCAGRRSSQRSTRTELPFERPRFVPAKVAKIAAGSSALLLSLNVYSGGMGSTSRGLCRTRKKAINTPSSSRRVPAMTGAPFQKPELVILPSKICCKVLDRAEGRKRLGSEPTRVSLRLSDGRLPPTRWPLQRR